MSWRALTLVLTAAAVSPAALAADNLYTRFFTGVDGGRPCYVRVYDDAHLKAHPKQTVRRAQPAPEQGRRMAAKAAPSVV